MATTQVVTSCEGDPNFGIILSFMEQFGPVLDVGDWNIAELKAMLENTESVPQALVDLHIKLMRKINKKVPPAKWELNLAKFAHSYSHQDAWEIERFGYKTANLAVKLRVLKALLEGQFDLNTKFKTQINTTVANELRLDPLGRDRQGNSYWYFMDNSANLQIYQMDAEMECWTLVASNRDEFVKMIEMLKENRPIEPLPVPEFVEEEEDSGADSTSESEAMKRGMIPAPTEAPPSLIISRRTYKTVTDHTEKPLSSATAADVDGSKEQQKEDNTADVKMEEDADCKREERPAVDIALNDTKTVKQKEEEQATEAPTPGHAIKEESLELKPSKTEANDAKEDEAMCVDKEPEKTNSVDTATPGREKSESDEVPMEVDEKPEVPLPKAEKDASPDVAVLPSDAAAKVDSEEQLQEVIEKSSSKESLPADTRKEESEEPSPDAKGESPDKVTVGEAIEDPPVMVQGEGSGADCDSATVQPLFSEVIEEPIMFFYGAGAGAENDMGNTKKVESTLATAHKDAGNNGEGTSLSGANGTEAAATESATADAEAEVDGSKNSPLKKIAITKGNDTSEEGQKDGKVDEDANGGQRVASDDEDNDETEAKESHKGKAPRDKGTGNKRTKKSATPAAAEVEEPSTDAKVSAALRGKQKTEVPSETGSVLVVEKKRGRKAATPRRAAAAVAAVVVSQEAESSEDASLKVDTEAASAVIPLKSDEAVGTELKFNIKSDENGENTKHKDVPIEQEKSVKQETKEDDIKVKQEQSAATVEDASKQPESSGDGEAVAKNEEAPSDPTTNDQQQKQTTDVEKAADEGGTGATEGESPTKKKRRQRNGLVDGLDISMVLDAGADGGGTVRQSRRIAMQKIKEETNRRQIEDQMLKKMKADAVQKKKDLGMQISDDDEYRKSASSDSSSSTDGGLGGEGGGRRRKKKKRKKKKGSLLQQQQQEQLLQQQLSKKHAKWNSATSSESSSETEAEDYFAEEHYHSEEDVRRTNALKSDHEFSPESDLESEAPAQPLKRARTARKAKRVTREEAEEEEEEDEDEGNEDHACQECKKMDQPEWILLCDSCDKGYHCACLKPVLFTIPEGDWFCPVCQHRQLIVRLQSKLDLFDALQAKLAAEERRRREEEQFAREAELAEQALANEREARLKAEKRARQQQRLLERADAAAERRSATGSGSDSESDGDDDDGDEDARERKEESRRQKRKRRQRQNRSAAKKRRSVSASGSDRSENDSRSGGSGSNTTDSDDIPIYKLRRRASAKVSYKFNEYDNLIDSAIRREMRNCEVIEDQQEEDEDDDHRRPADEDEEEDGYGMSKGKDISTIIEATAREEAARKKALLGASNTDAMDKAGGAGDGDNERLVNGGSDDGERQQMVAASRKALARVVDEEEEEDSEGVTGVRPKAASTGGQNRGSAGQAQKKRKKKKKLCQIELSSEEEAGDDDSDEDFRGDVSGSEDDEDEEEDDDEDDEMNSMSGDSESSLEVRGRGNRVRKPSGRAAAKRRRIVENSDDSDEDEEEEEADRRRKSAKGGRKGRVLEDSDDELDLDDEEDDSEDYDSDDLCSDTETELSRSSSSGSSSSNSSSGASSSDGDWRKKKKKKKDKKSKSKGGKASSKTGATGGSGGGGGGAGARKHIERPKKATTGKGSGGGRGKKGLAAGSSDRSASDRSSESGSDVGGKGGKTMPRIAKKQGKKTGPAGGGGAAAGDSDGSVGAGEKKSDRKTRGKKIHYIVDEDFESSDDGIRPGVQRPDTPPEEREQFIRRQEEIKRMLAENNAAKAKELATSKIDQLVGTGAGAAAAGSRAALKDGSKDSLSVVPMQVIESARVLDIDFLKSTSGNTARIATVDSVVDFDDELPEDFDPDDEMDDEALAKIMEEEDFAHHQLKPTAVAVPVTPGAPDVPPVTASAATTGAKSRRKSIDPDEFALLQQQQQQQQQHRASAIARVPGAHGKEHPHPPHLPPAGSQLPVNLSPSGPPYSAIVQSPMKALLKTPSGPAPPPAITGGIPTSTIISPNVASTGGGASTILANALQTVPPPHHHHHGPHHPATLPPPPLLKEPPMSGRPDVLMRHGPGPGPGPGLGPGNLPPHPSLSSLGVPPELHHKPELAHLISGLTGVPLRLPKGAGPPIHHAAGAGHHRMPPVTGPGLTMPPSMLGHAPHLKPSVGPPPPPATSSNSIAAHSQAPAASTVATSSSSSNAERRAGRRKKITPLREDLKRKGAGEAPIPAAHQEGPAAVPPASQLPPPPPHHHSQQPPFLSHPPHHPHHHLGGGHGVPRLPSHGATGPPVRPPPTITSSHNTAQQNASAIAAAAAAAAAVQELAIKVQQTRPDGTATGGSSNSGSSNSSSNMHINEPPISVPSSVSHLSYLSENPLFAHRLGPLPSSILASSSSSLQRIAAMSGAGPPFGDPAAYNGGWKPPPGKPKTTGATAGPGAPPPGMMVGPPVGPLEHYHDYNPATHYNPYYNVLDRAHHLRPPSISELHRTSTLSPTTFTTLQPVDAYQHGLKPGNDPPPHHHHHHPHHHHPHHAAATAAAVAAAAAAAAAASSATAAPTQSATSSSAITAVDDSSNSGGGDRLTARPPSSSSIAAAPPPETVVAAVAAAAPTAASSSSVPSVSPPTVAESMATPPSAAPVAAPSSSASTSVFGELVSYFSSQQDDLDS